MFSDHPTGMFISGARAPLFAMYYPAQGRTQTPGETLLYVHPFAGEMANSRDVIAGLAREAARRGTAVLVPDLFGCGDSAGEFVEARWDIWLDDLEAACCWLEENTDEALSLWGLRFGALLGMNFAHLSGRGFNRYLLWQPVTNGAEMLTQFIRMNLFAEDISATIKAQVFTPDLRSTLEPGICLPVAGLRSRIRTDGPDRSSQAYATPRQTRPDPLVRTQASYWAGDRPRSPRRDRKMELNGRVGDCA